MKNFLAVFNTVKLSSSSLKQLQPHVCSQPFILAFNIATLKLGTIQTPTAHLVFKYMKKISKQLKEAINSGPPHVVNMIKPMKEKLNKYWSRIYLPP